jgi:hypothetical protein
MVSSPSCGSGRWGRNALNSHGPWRDAARPKGGRPRAVHAKTREPYPGARATVPADELDAPATGLRQVRALLLLPSRRRHATLDEDQRDVPVPTREHGKMHCARHKTGPNGSNRRHGMGVWDWALKRLGAVGGRNRERTSAEAASSVHHRRGPAGRPMFRRALWAPHLIERGVLVLQDSAMISLSRSHSPEFIFVPPGSRVPQRRRSSPERRAPPTDQRLDQPITSRPCPPRTYAA